MDLQIFEKRVLPTKNKLFRFALRFLGSEEDAKDVVQEVLIKVWNGRQEMNEIQNWEAWCMQITKNLSLDRIRVMNRRQTQPIEHTYHLPHQAPSPYESAEMQENMQKIAQLIASLPEKQRQIIHLRDVEGYTYQEISEILQLDMSQVKVNLFRARNAIRERITKIDAYGL